MGTDAQFRALDRVDEILANPEIEADVFAAWSGFARARRDGRSHSQFVVVPPAAALSGAWLRFRQRLNGAEVEVGYGAPERAAENAPIGHIGTQRSR